MRLTPLALAAGLLFSGGNARAQDGPPLEPNRSLKPAPRGDAAARLPIILRAQRISARPDIDATADGGVEFRRGGVAISADHLSYDSADDLARASGHVKIVNDNAIYSGPEVQLQVQRFKGFFLAPEFEFTQIGAGGRADRVDFLDSARAVAINAIYTSCPRDGSGDPDWVLKARRVEIDVDTNTGIAEGAVLRFLGVPILAAPRLTFPLNDERKSGWLPPSVNLDSRSGFGLAVPYYWNIAPNRDATLTPRVITRRGLGLDSEFRYLEPAFNGRIDVNALPDDRVAGRSRASLLWKHDGTLGAGLHYAADVVRVSDNDWWKDFPDAGRSITPRLLSGSANIEQSLRAGDASGLLYARVQHWQVLQGSDLLVTPPYQRSPQVGVRLGGPAAGGLEFSVESEVNRFTLPAGEADPNRLTGLRWHALGSLSRPWRDDAGWFIPKLAFNAASYHTEQAFNGGRHSAGRVIPTFSVDAGLEFERQTQAFGFNLRQTLEPRVLYVNTPYREQTGLPVFDTAAKDFNFTSIYSENAFSGVDRVSDAHQITSGVTTRLVDADTGAEKLRLGLVQRYLFRDQLVTANADGTPDGPPLQQHLSDVLLLASTRLVPAWTLDGTLQYSPDVSRPVRSIFGMRYSPGPYRTLNATYRFTRGVSEQLEVGWQWPLHLSSAPTPASIAAQAGHSGVGAAAHAYAGNGGNGCGGSWYAVGRVNYSLRDTRITDSILGVEYDAGCWIGRIVAERLSTGTSEATTRLLFQLELVGLSRIGSNPLKVLKDNIPGYRLLREDRRATTEPDE